MRLRRSYMLRNRVMNGWLTANVSGRDFNFTVPLPVASRVMEAMACGKPCIVSDIRGNHDLIQNEKGGYLVKQNCEEYVESIQRLLNDPRKRDSFGMYNKERIKDYGLDRVLEQMSSIYRQYM